MNLNTEQPEASSDEQRVTASNVDLSNCDRELVQYSGAVQPHGALVTLSGPELYILQVSANSNEFFGIDAVDLVGRHLADLLGARQTEQIQQKLAREPAVTAPPQNVLWAEIGGRSFHVFAHRIDGVVVLEFEAATAALPVIDLYSDTRAAISRLQNTQGLQAFFNLAVEEIQRLTGFDRVMAYEFLPDGSGHVIAESVQPGLDAYLGLHYPASDVPQPARRLFSMMWLRHLPNVDYTPVALVPEVNPVTNGPLDLSYVSSRHVSVMYSKYLQNMGVKSTLVITLLKNGQLWGLISCMNHASPKQVPYEARMACEFLAHMVSLLMSAKEDAETYEYRLKIHAVMDQLVEQATRERSMPDGLVRRSPTVLSAIDAHGAAVVSAGTVTTLGITPKDDEIRALAGWLSSMNDPVFVTDRLSELYPPAATFQAAASGLLAAHISRSGPDSVMWFRPEIPTTVKWAGDPQKPVEVLHLDTETRLQPRTSFAIWQQELRGRSTPWKTFEIDAVRGLRHALIELVVVRAEELTRINRELEKSNVELDSFAYVASHDLKEPLRGIHNYSTLIRRTASDRLSADELSRLETVLRLTKRMDDLIEGLLQYSRVGRVDLAFQPMDLNEVVRGALDLLHSQVERSGAQIHVTPLPTITCDRVRIREVFYNLISNALKYNNSDLKQVEIGFTALPEPVFHVRDNGIGIEAEQFEQIFKIFKRLHGRDEYGGGTGAGLTIARKSVERHGGRMWVESTLGQGSTFFFTLPEPLEASNER